MHVFSEYWYALPAVAASVAACGVLYTKVVRPVVSGVATLIDYAEFLHNEVAGKEGSIKSQLEQIDGRVEAMDEVWSKWVFSHAHEHAEIWRILALLGYDRRHYYTPEQEPK